MSIMLRPPTREECQLVRIWRNAPDVLPMLRTGFKTEAEQDAFYRDVICNPLAQHRYFALEHDGQFIGLGGLTHCVRGEAEISLIIGPTFRQQGLGAQCVDALLSQGFVVWGLRAVVGECYAESPALGFWLKMITNRWPAEATWEPGKALRWQWRCA